LFAAVPAAAQTTDQFFDDGVLHDIHLVVNSRDWQNLKDNFELDTHYPCNLSWRGLTVRDAAIRSRGFGSRSGAKPALRVDFDRYLTGGRFLGLRSLILENLVQDPSMIRERVSMLFFRRLGWPASRVAHVRLHVNGEYVGLYSSVEDINEEFLERAFGVSQEAIAAGGYLYEYRWRYHYAFTHLGPRLERYEEIFDPKIKAHKSLSELLAPIEDLIRTVNETAEENFTRVVGEFLDLRALMTYLAIENVLAEWDGFLGDFGMNNFYVARFEPRRFAPFIPWDKDNAMVRDPANPARAIEQSITRNFNENVLARKALASPDLRDAYHDDLLRAADVAAAWMEDEIVHEFQQIREAALADPVKPYSNAQFEEAIAYLLRFARERPAFVRTQVATAAASR
jgi:spore coat protein H